MSYPGAGSDHLVGEEVEVKPGLHEDVLAELDDLQGEHVLSAIVSDLEMNKKKLKRPSLRVSCRRDLP